MNKLIWKCTHKHDPKTIFVASPTWFAARVIAMTIMNCEPSELLAEPSVYHNPYELAHKGYEVYLAKFDKESKFMGAEKVCKNE